MMQEIEQAILDYISKNDPIHLSDVLKYMKDNGYHEEDIRTAYWALIDQEKLHVTVTKETAKRWVNCPSCGSTGTMKYKENLYHTFTRSTGQEYKIGPLEGHFCTQCNDGIYTEESIAKITEELS